MQEEAINQYAQNMKVKPKRIYVDKGYRGHDPSLKLNVFKSGQKRLAPQIKKEMRRRSAIEAVIGHNFRLLLNWFRDLCSLFFISSLEGVLLPDF